MDDDNPVMTMMVTYLFAHCTCNVPHLLVNYVLEDEDEAFSAVFKMLIFVPSTLAVNKYVWVNL